MITCPMCGFTGVRPGEFLCSMCFADLPSPGDSEPPSYVDMEVPSSGDPVPPPLPHLNIPLKATPPASAFSQPGYPMEAPFISSAASAPIAADPWPGHQLEPPPFRTGPVSAQCPRCGGSNRTVAKFCSHCGAILSSPDPFPPTADVSTFREMVSFHRASVREYAEMWFVAAFRAERDVTAGDAAYHLCRHASMLRRFTGDPAAIVGLIELPSGERTRLLAAVGVYLQGMALGPTAERILEADVIEQEDLERLEDLLLARDEVEEVLRLARELSIGLAEQDRAAVRPGLAAAAAQAALFDDVVQARPDALSTIGTTLAAMKDHFAEPAVGALSWWFSMPLELAHASDETAIFNLLPSRAIQPQSGQGHPVHPPAPAPGLRLLTNPVTLPFVVRTPGADDVPLVLSAKPEFALAAASSTAGHGSVYVQSPEQPTVRGLILLLLPWTYQFIALDDQRERTNDLDGAEVIALADTVEVGRASLVLGVATLTASDEMRRCVLRTLDGRELHLISVS